MMGVTMQNRARPYSFVFFLTVALWLAGTGLVADASPPADEPTTAPATAPAPNQVDASPLGKLEVLAEFPLGSPSDMIVVPVEFKGKRYLFLLDTGSAYSTFDKEFAGSLGPSLGTENVATTTGLTERQVYGAPNAHLGAVNLRAGRYVWQRDLSNRRKAEGSDIRGIVGVGAFRRYALRLDYDAGKGFIFRPDRAEHKEWGMAIPMEFSDGETPFVYARVNGGPELKHTLDTGWSGEGSLYQSFFDRYTREWNLPVDESSRRKVDGNSAPYAKARFKTLSVGGYKYRDVVLDRGRFSVLGRRFFSRHVVTMDFANGRLYLKKGKQFSQRERASWFVGVGYVWDGRVNKRAVPGVGGRDFMLKIKGRDTVRLGLRVRWRVGRPGREITLAVEKNGRQYGLLFSILKGV